MSGLDKWKKNSAEAEMKEAGKEMMEKARLERIEREAKEEAKLKEIGKWTITLKSSTEHTKEDIENFITKLLEFESQSNGDFPMLRVHIDPIV